MQEFTLTTVTSTWESLRPFGTTCDSRAPLAGLRVKSAPTRSTALEDTHVQSTSNRELITNPSGERAPQH